MSGASLMGCVRVECLHMVQYCVADSSASACSLMRDAPGQSVTPTNAVDLYNSATGTWSTASLSVARAYLAATSIGNLALFAGGRTAGGALLCSKKAGRVGVAQ
jgi:hypothetical protein